MRSLKVKIAIILSTLFILMITTILTFIILINNDKLIFLLEQQIHKIADLDVNIGHVHVNVFSGITFHDISIESSGFEKPFAFTCKTFAIQYKLLGIVKGNIQNISLSDTTFDVALEADKMRPAQSTDLHDTEEPALSIKDWIPDYINIEDVTLNNTTMRLKQRNRTIVLSGTDMHITNFQPDGKPEFSLSSTISIATSPDALSSVTGQVTMDGRYDLMNDKLILDNTSHVVLDQIGVLKIGGNARSLTANPSLDFMVNSRNITISAILPILTELGMKNISLPTLTGTANVELTVKGDLNKFRVTANISVNDLTVTNKRLIFEAKYLEIPFVAIISPYALNDKTDAEGTCIIKGGQFSIEGQQMMTIDIPIHFSMEYPNTATVSSHAMKGSLFFDNHPYPIDELISDLQMNLNLDQPNNINIEVSIQTKFSDPIFLSGTFDMGKKALSNSTIKIDEIDCNKLSKTLKYLIPEFYKEWEFNGCISLDIALIPENEKKTDGTTISTNISLADLGFNSPDYDYFGENIDGNIKVDLTIDSLFNRFSFHTNCVLEPFLIQLGSFTTDMKNRQTLFSFSGGYAPENKNLSNIRGALSWEDIGTITIDGELLSLTEKPHMDIHVVMKELSHTSLFETFVKDTIQYSHPSLFQSRIEGKFNGQFHVFGSQNSMDVDGNINIKESNVTLKDFSLDDLNVDLPISISYPLSKDPIQKQDVPDTRYGTVKIKKITQGPLEIVDLNLSPIIITNNFFIKDSLKIPIFGGAIEIKDVSVENMINPDRKIKLAFQFQDINLEEITATYNLTPTVGTLNSSLLPFVQKRDRLYSQGEMKIDLFGGNITISNFRVNNFLTPLMGIGFSAEINSLNLGEMSDTYREWGAITGIVNGEIKDFRFVAGEPSGFNILLKTDQAADTKQTVSAKFLKKFVPGIGTVLETVGLTNYRYSVMGLHAVLKNDYITLRGAVREGGKDLFMKGAGLKKLEIVFHDANKKIPYKKFVTSFMGILSSNFEDTQLQFK
ncbi:MAG: hypothetical protein MRK02_13220 [Candidatus Scalindua sp.]|nr:hypothetical protein [Candidatus Scalindua sp.]